MGLRRLLIVRHGNTFDAGDTIRRIGAGTDLPLTAEGEAQARRIAMWLRMTGIAPDRILTGPLWRARRSASLVAALLPHAVSPIEAGWLNEIDHGPDEGRPEPEVRDRIGDAALAAWDRVAVPPPGWPIDRERLIADCRTNVAALDGETTLLVTSNGIARFILIALGLETAPPSLKLRTGALGEVAMNGGTPTLVRWDFRP